MALQVIGVGMGRTGTASLKVALDEIGFGPCYHMSEVLKNPARAQDWIDAADGNPDWDKIFADYTATVDNPGCGFWKKLASYYPDAKVILTVRDANDWFESTFETIHSPELSHFIKNSPLGEMIHRTIYHSMDYKMHDRAHMVNFFNSRTEEIKQTIAAERLLIYKVEEGWDSLCTFLNVSVPDMDFPRVNSRKETKAFISEMIKASGDKLSNDAMSAAGERQHKT